MEAQKNETRKVKAAQKTSKRKHTIPKVQEGFRSTERCLSVRCRRCNATIHKATSTDADLEVITLMKEQLCKQEEEEQTARIGRRPVPEH